MVVVVKMDKIITNKIKCRKCGDVLESVFTHDLKRCKCGAVEIDGGKEYLRRSAKNLDDIIELSTVINEDEIQEKDMIDIGISKELFQKFQPCLKWEILLIKKARLGEIELPVDCLQDEISADINMLCRSRKITDEESIFLKKVLEV